jgi:CRISPR-associated protein Cmr1
MSATAPGKATMRGRFVTEEVELSLATPAFLGGADQAAEWRTPGIKALLRQCWRLLAAREVGYDHARLHEKEGELFGQAASRERTSRSLLTLSLTPWAPGELTRWPRDLFVKHDEVERARDGVGAHLYLGYGPLTYKKGTGTDLKAGRALDAGSVANLRLRFPHQKAGEIGDVLPLAHLLGTIGGRSRNGWGSIQIKRSGHPLPGLRDQSSLKLLERIARDWRDCLRCDWPHALGTDGRLLLWTTGRQQSWQQLMKVLAEVKISFRTDLKFQPGPNLQARHLLAYPVTHHEVPRWGRNARLANQIRFSAHRAGDSWYGIVAHLPCRLPKGLRDELPAPAEVGRLELEVWPRVHQVLDKKLERLGGAMT